MKIQLTHPRATIEHFGLIPEFLHEGDPATAVEQFDRNYISGWNPFTGFTLSKVDDRYELIYPEDPPMREIGRILFRDEVIVLFEGEWVAVIQQDGSHSICRMD